MFVCVCVCAHIRFAALVKDYCGSVSEKTVQLNFALIYELLDEVVVSPSERISTTPTCHHDNILQSDRGGGAIHSRNTESRGPQLSCFVFARTMATSRRPPLMS